MNDEGRVTTSSLVLIPCLAAANIEVFFIFQMFNSFNIIKKLELPPI